MVNKDRLYAYIISTFQLLVMLAESIILPLFLDSLIPVSSPLLNITGVNFTSAGNICLEPAIPVWEKIDPLVHITICMAMDTLILGAGLIVIYCFFPSKITSRERNYPKRYLVIVGVSQSTAALMYQYSSPGTRTAPYIQAFLNNLTIPIVFILRFFILHKRPTLRKALCALVILLSGCVALIPTFVPSLETKEEHEREGGAIGPWNIIWPFIYLLSNVPAAIGLLILEVAVKHTQTAESNTTILSPADASTNVSKPSNISRNVENEDGSATCTNDQPSSMEDSLMQEYNETSSSEALMSEEDGRIQDHVESNPQRLNIVYTMFWTFLCTFLGVVGMFWVDFIPGFGMQQSIKQFLPQVAFNLKCIIGLTDVCGPVTISLAWARTLNRTASFILRTLILRYSEGTNFYTLLKTCATPLRLLFWTLFQEHPFRWKPTMQISVWLSMGAILVMIPSVIIYEIGPPEISSKIKNRCTQKLRDTSDQLTNNDHNTLEQDEGGLSSS